MRDESIRWHSHLLDSRDPSYPLMFLSQRIEIIEAATGAYQPRGRAF
jgi:hypothetical protein